MRLIRSNSPTRVAALLATLSFVAASACGSKGAVAVTATLHDPEAIVGRSSGLAALLTGGFGLHLDLGQAAPSGTDISIGQGNFNLVTPDQATLLVLKFTTSPGAPYHLEPGAKLDIACTIADQTGTPGQLLTKDEETAVCASRAAVQIAGSIADANGQIPVTSLSFTVACP
jgi:hypothetical protein